MVHVGIDIGTTNIAITAIDLENRNRNFFSSLPNCKISGGADYEYNQNPQAIEDATRALLNGISGPIASICVTGQVHGIVYYNREGLAVSPLYTWLDQRALMEENGKTIQQQLRERTGRNIPVGYGLLTHYSNRVLGLVPSGAAGFCGILEYITSRLTGEILKQTDSSSLATFGGYDPGRSCFDPAVVEEVFRNAEYRFLDVSKPFSIAGYTADGIPVAYPVGDNQAGFFGMVPDWDHTALISIGTSGQVSLFSQTGKCSEAMELRPFFGEGYLHVGAALAAGKAYETVRRFFASVLQYADISFKEEMVFDLMKKAAGETGRTGTLKMDTRFAGTRQDATISGSLTNIGLENFTAGNLVQATVSGIAEELYGLYIVEAADRLPVSHIVATGSSVQKNILFADALRTRFNMPVLIPEIVDGAGFGAALTGAVSTGAISLKQSREYVRQIFN